MRPTRQERGSLRHAACAEQNGGNRQEIQLYRNAQRFVPAGQSTQMIIGRTPETDFQIIHVAEALYKKFGLKRVFYSAFVHVNEDTSLPARTGEGPPLLRNTDCTRRISCSGTTSFRLGSF